MEGFRKLIFQNAGRDLLMLGVHERIQKIDCDRLYAIGLQSPHRFAQCGLVQWCFNSASRQNTLFNTEAQVTLDQKFRLICLEIIEVRAFLTADFQQIAETTGRQKPCFCATTLNERVCGNRCTVTDIRNVLGLDAYALDAIGHTLRDPARRVIRCR